MNDDEDFLRHVLRRARCHPEAPHGAENEVEVIVVERRERERPPVRLFARAFVRLLLRSLLT